MSVVALKVTWPLPTTILISSLMQERQQQNPSQSLGSCSYPRLTCGMCTSPTNLHHHHGHHYQIMTNGSLWARHVVTLHIRF